MYNNTPNPSNVRDFRPKILQNNVNPGISVFFDSFRSVPMYQGFTHF